MQVNTTEPTDWQQLRLERPELFECVSGQEIGHHCYDVMGNFGLLQMPMLPVHIRRLWSAEGKRNYMNHCILEARHGAVLVGPFISADEKRVMRQALLESLPVVLLYVGAFREADCLPHDWQVAQAEGRLLLLSPWPDRDVHMRLSRQECETLNKMAEDLAAQDWFE